MKYMYDVVVVGAGPSGTAAARACAAAGLATLCIEEHATIGHPVQCAGLLSRDAFAGCGVSDRAVLHTVRGARIFYGEGESLTFRAPEAKAFIVDRGGLDREMAARAADAGSEFLLKGYVAGITSEGVVVRGGGGTRQICCRLVIAADGPRSTIARLQGMERARFFYSGIQAEIPCGAEEDLVEVHPHASPDFFGWVIPIGRGRARVGLAGEENVQQRFRTFLQGRSDRCLDLVTGTIPFGPMPRTYGKRVLYVGDAAGLIKPTSGGGVYTGVRSARHAATVAVSCCECGDFSDRKLAHYEHLWKADFGRELALGYRLLAARRTMSREDMDRILRTLDTPGMRDLIVAYGDMDRPGRLVHALLRRPDLLGTAASLVWSVLRSGMKYQPI